MNKTDIKNFAIFARTELIRQTSQRAYEYGITENDYGKENVKIIGGRILTDTERKQRNELVDQIKKKGYVQVMEEAAYTWFNRFIALRFMEVNNYLPSHVRVFSDAAGAFAPEILKDVLHLELDGIDHDIVAKLIESGDTEALYKYLLITQCNALNPVLPLMFERISNYTELLLPNNLLKQESVIAHMVNDIDEDSWKNEVQIIGWLYQYYNTELKDETFALLKKNVKVSKEHIPAATQLFTPDWIVRYMVENSLGRLWIERTLAQPEGLTFPMSFPTTLDDRYDQINRLKPKWKYYLDEAEQKPEVKRQLAEIRKSYKNLKPEDIKVIDPCMGSGHILVYAFDVLMQIYESQGWNQREAAESILKNNLYGLDIDDRAGQLAYFALIMKARQYNRRILNGNITCHLYSIQESNGLSSFEHGAGQLELDDMYIEVANYLIEAFRDAKEYGSILNIEPRNYDGLLAYIDELEKNGARDIYTVAWLNNIKAVMPALIQQAKLLSQKYDVVVTNPPYMGSSNMDSKLSEYVKKQFSESKSDLFAVFIEKNLKITKKSGYTGMVTMHSWMFLSSFYELRKIIVEQNTISSILHLGMEAFDDIIGKVVSTTAFVINPQLISLYKMQAIRLVDYYDSERYLKETQFFNKKNRFTAAQKNFSKIPGMPIAYWVSANMFMVFNNNKLPFYADIKKGLSTGNVEQFTRLWFEVVSESISYSCRNTSEARSSGVKWFPYIKGGEFNRWFGNQEWIVNWENDGIDVKNYVDDKGKQRSRPQNLKYYFCKALSYTAISSYKFSTRYMNRSIFGGGGDAICVNSPENFNYIFAFLNSEVANNLLNIISPTLNYEVGHIMSLPIIISEEYHALINFYVVTNIDISKTDWDSFETSWNFVKHPLLHGTSTISEAYSQWQQFTETKFTQLKSNEEELNRIFIDIYGLQDELTPEVEDKDVTVARIYDTKEDIPESMKGNNYVLTKCDVIKSFISYAVGCMFGRYSLDVDGLAFAGGDWDACVSDTGRYKTFMPDKDNIIPITDDDYFEDDMVGRFVEFVRAAYGEKTLEENLKFIADALGGKDTPRETIRGYFLNDFYKDHCKTYKKRPIYWLFDSGKKNGFKALIYMHRYQPDLLARMRTDYVHEQQERYRTQLSHIADAIIHADSSAKVKLSKQQEKIQAQQLELRMYEENVKHQADKMIPIDLDDGVKVNYAKFADVLAPIK